ncbi:MAG TPA: NAD(P)/FAD-dependent oxidoreductase [Anaerolineaceae bacterium]
MQKKSVIIIGAGIAGLSAGIYAQMNGYQSRIYEMHDLPGGLMTAWKRKGYVIDGCIHWLTGSSKDYQPFYQMWEDIGLIQGRTIFDPEVFMRWESKDGKVLCLYTDVNRLEAHLLELAPEDRKVIRAFCAAVRAFSGNMSSTPEGLLGRLIGMVKMVPQMPHMMRWGRLTMKELGEKFTNPFLRSAFSEMWFPEMSAMGLVFTLAILNNHGAGYPIGGSLPMALAVEKRYCALGGEIFYDARVSKILTEALPGGQGSRVVGIRLDDGREERADIVISAADAHATLYQMLDDRFTTDQFRGMFQSAKIFPPILYIGLGVDRAFPDLPACTGGLELELDEPVMAAGLPIHRLSTMVYNFDPSLAPQGKTALTVMAPTSYQYWKDLYGEGGDHERYEAEKQRVALQVIDRLDKRFPGLSAQVEMADVATPVTFERFTGNWQGSFEGWIPTPQNVMKPIPKTLPGLENFYMVGQWVQPGGGLPSGVMTGREVLQKICKKDGIKFSTAQ